jgi:hypothetical protein
MGASEDFVRRIELMRDRLQPEFPDIDPGDLLLIIKALLRPQGARRRFFLRKLRSGGYVV